MEEMRGANIRLDHYTNCQHGGANNLMVWSCMGWKWVGELVEVQGKMDCEILEEGVKESFESLEMAEDQWCFQQDNNSKHGSRKTEQWFSDNNIIPLRWPAQCHGPRSH